MKNKKRAKRQRSLVRFDSPYETVDGGRSTQRFNGRVVKVVGRIRNAVELMGGGHESLIIVEFDDGARVQAFAEELHRIRA